MLPLGASWSLVALAYLSGRPPLLRTGTRPFLSIRESGESEGAMTNAQFAQIKAGIDRLNKNQASLMEEFKILRKVIAQGEDRDYPWYHLEPGRRKQVEAVVDYLRKHPNRELYTVRRAAYAAYIKTYGGYPTKQALSACCYAVKISNWID